MKIDIEIYEQPLKQMRKSYEHIRKIVIKLMEKPFKIDGEPIKTYEHY